MLIYLDTNIVIYAVENAERWPRAGAGRRIRRASWLRSWARLLSRFEDQQGVPTFGIDEDFDRAVKGPAGIGFLDLGEDGFGSRRSASVPKTLRASAAHSWSDRLRIAW